MPPDDRDGLERLARYLLRPPVSLERLHVDEHGHTIVYAARLRAGHGPHPAAGALRAKASAVPAPNAPSDPDVRALRRSWAQLIRRIYEVDPLACPWCGATMRIIAFITEPKVIHTILRHLAAKGVDARSPPGSAKPHPAAA